MELRKQLGWNVLWWRRQCISCISVLVLIVQEFLCDLFGDCVVPVVSVPYSRNTLTRTHALFLLWKLPVTSCFWKTLDTVEGAVGGAVPDVMLLSYLVDDRFSVTGGAEPLDLA